MGECVKEITLDEAIENARKVANSCHQPLMAFETMNSIVKDNYREKNEQLAQWLEELKEYKELEEQGRLLKLPCKIGDTLWWISNEDEEGNERLCVMRCEQPISVIGIDCDEDIIVIVGDPETNTIDKLGNRWACLTKEEAEAKLKEMEDEKDA